MTALDGFWAGYAATLTRVRAERPSTVWVSRRYSMTLAERKPVKR